MRGACFGLWSGLGRHPKNPQIQSAFLKGAIALELLLVGKDTNFVTQSITARLADTLAILVRSTPEDRFEVERLTKKLYSTRSAVAHSGKSSVGWVDVYQVLSFGREAVYTLLSDEDLRKMQSIDDVIALFARKKYSFTDFKETGTMAPS